jgi:nucleoid-associated protein YgaU
MIKKVYKVTPLIVALALLGACATVKKAPPPPPPKKPSAATLQAIRDAETAIANAQQVGCNVTSEQSEVSQAKAQAKIPDNQKAQSLADAARTAANQCANRYWLRKARADLAKIRQYTNLNSSERSSLRDGRADINNNEGKAAYNTLSALLSELEAARTTYTVVRGDNLWNIAAKHSVYRDPFEWPLIYRSNASKIHDPDLIYPNEELKIILNPVKSAVRSAKHYAKTRGPWRNGQALSKDHAWLASQQGSKI